MIHSRLLRRPLRGIVVGALLCLATLPAAPADAHRSARSLMTEPVYLVHGFSHGTNCRARWRQAMAVWRRKGWRGPFRTVAYYRSDRSCNSRIGSNTRNTSILRLGRQLAWAIYRRDSRRGRSVDVVGHSMGGLIARVALAGTWQRWRGFPPFLYVQDAVALGTPHRGVTASWVHDCHERQCVEMRPGSGFLRKLARRKNQNPRSRQRTDWTLIASEDDATAAPSSALGMSARHYIVYARGQGLGHRLPAYWRGDRTYRLRYWNYWDRRGWRRTRRGRSPVVAAGGAIKHTRKG